MVDILPPRHNFASAFGEGLVENLSQLPEQLSDALSAYQQRKRDEQEQDVLAKLSAGEEVSPQERKKLKVPTLLKYEEISQKREAANKTAKNEFEIQKDKETQDKFEKYFGPAAAELYPYLTEGGKSKLFEALLDGKLRGLNTDQILTKYIKENPQDIKSPEQEQKNQLLRRPGEENLIPKEIAEKRERQEKFKIEHETKRSDKILEDAYEASKSFPLRRANIDLIKNAIHDVGGIDQDFIAEVFHFEPLRTAKGAQLKSAGKDLFIKTIQGTGNRPNQWIEQQIGSALTEIGKTSAANATIAEIAKFQLDLDEKKVQFINELEEKYENELGYIPGKIGREADEKLKSYAAKRQDQLAYDLREIYEKEQGVEKLSKLNKVPRGTPLTRAMAKQLKKRKNGNVEAAENLAKKIGYVIPERDVYMKGER